MTKDEAVARAAKILEETYSSFLGGKLGAAHVSAMVEIADGFRKLAETIQAGEVRS